MSASGKRRDLSRFVEAARTDMPDENDLAGALGALLPAGEAHRFDRAVPAATKTAALVKIVATGVVVIGVAAAVLVRMTPRDSVGEPPSARHPVQASNEAPSAPSGLGATPVPPAADSAAVAEQPSTPPRKRRATPGRGDPPRLSNVDEGTAVAPSGSAAFPPETSAGAEATLVESVRRALRENPAHALELAAEHARLFPSGLLALERQALTIHALALLGRRPEACVRLAALEKANPRSIHVTRLRRILGGEACSAAE